MERRFAVRRRRGQEGAAAVEFALVMPLLMLIVFGIIVYGMVFAQSLSLSNAARQAARAGVIQGTTCTQIATLAQDAARHRGHEWLCCLGLDQTRRDRGSATATCSSTPSAQPCSTQPVGTNIYVTLTYAPSAIVPLVPVPSQLRGKGVYRCEFSVRKRDERGAVALLVGVLSVALLGIGAFSVDFGLAYATKRQLSIAADAASLAAGAVYKTQYKGLCTVPGNDPNSPIAANAAVRANAEAAADALFTQNFPQGTATSGTITNLSCNGTGVQVTYSASGTSNAPLGRLLGGSGTITTAGTAAAAYSVGGGICALCVIGDVNTNNTDFTVTGGDIYVDGNVGTGPNSHWTATNSITISGTVSGLSQANATPDYSSGPHITDPFASVTLPSSPYTGLVNKGASGNPCTQGPGIYGSYNIKNETCVLQQGAYVFTGGLTFQNTDSHLTSNNLPVTLFFAGPNGHLDIKNGDVFNLAAPTSPVPAGFPSTWPAGFAIIYARNNTQPLELQGNGDSFPDVLGQRLCAEVRDHLQRKCLLPGEWRRSCHRWRQLGRQQVVSQRSRREERGKSATPKLEVDQVEAIPVLPTRLHGSIAGHLLWQPVQ